MADEIEVVEDVQPTSPNDAGFRVMLRIRRLTRRARRLARMRR